LTVRFSVWPNLDRTYEEVLELVATCERLGWHAAYVADHFMPNGEDATPLRGDHLEATTTLAAIAARTSRIGLGTLVAAATYRHPAVLANAFAAIDRISNGRVIAGLGAGWQQNEHASYGIDLGTVPDRIDRFTEYVAVVQSMLSNELTTFHGTYYRLTDAPCDPRPVQSHVPLLLGVKGRRRTMAVAAQFADVWNAWTDPADLATCNADLDERCAALGRDPSTLARSTQALLFMSTDESWLAPFRTNPIGRASIVGTPSEVAAVVGDYQRAGCDELIIPGWSLGEQGRALETLELFDREVARHFGG
jgi:F420-dependent oxidoreductase-like protein